MVPNVILFLMIVASLVWGRYRFFKVSNTTQRTTVALYDVAVAVQIFYTLYLMATKAVESQLLLIISFVLYLTGLVIFWWSIKTAKSLDFAFSGSVSSIVTTGPFKYVRHPFYISYILVWLSSSLLFNSLILWITLAYLITFYFLSARKEERVIMQSVYSKEYEQYISDVGMFLPRIFKWAPSSSEP